MQETLLSFGLIILAGVAFKALKPGGLDADTLRNAINGAVLNLFLPALCISGISLAEVHRETFLIPATAWITTLLALAVSAGVYALAAKALRIGSAEQGVLVIAAAFGNVTYLGLPVLSALFGRAGVKYVLFFDLLATTPVLWLVGAPLAARYGSGGRFGPTASLKTILSLPPIWGIAAGLALNAGGVILPAFIQKALEMLGGLVAPLMVFSIGLALTIPPVRHSCAVVPALVMKLAMVPFIAFTSAHLLGLRGEPLAACVLEGAMPTMVLSLLIAARFRLDVSLAAFIVVVSTALAFFTLPLAAAVAGSP
jgi:predicted permease